MERPIDRGDYAEMRLLGSLLRAPWELDEVAQLVRDTSFRKDEHQRYFRSLVALNGRREIDLVTVAKQLQDSGEWESSDGAKLAELWDSEPTGANARHFAETVRDAHLTRSMASLGQELAKEANNPSCSPSEALATFETRLLELSEVGREGDVITLAPEYDRIFDEMDNPGKGEQGLLTGFHGLDDMLCGLRAGEMIIIAARPSTGKTALALTLARQLVTGRNAAPCFFASLEQGRADLAERLLAGEAGVNSMRIRDRTACAAVALGDAARVLRPAPLHIDDYPVQSVSRIAANARRLKRQHGIRCVIVDYLQLIEPEDKRVNRNEQVAEISRRLKALARSLMVPVVALAQLNRKTEDRANERPRLSDLRDSGQIEQDADVVLLLHKSTERPDIIEVLVEKQRNGPTGIVDLVFNRPFVRFEDCPRGPF